MNSQEEDLAAREERLAAMLHGKDEEVEKLVVQRTKELEQWHKEALDAQALPHADKMLSEAKAREEALARHLEAEKQQRKNKAANHKDFVEAATTIAAELALVAPLPALLPRTTTLPGAGAAAPYYCCCCQLRLVPLPRARALPPAPSAVAPCSPASAWPSTRRHTTLPAAVAAAAPRRTLAPAAVGCLLHRRAPPRPSRAAAASCPSPYRRCAPSRVASRPRLPPLARRSCRPAAPAPPPP
nr:atherin-like [Aegilops tauschii subsp. strangulata]